MSKKTRQNLKVALCGASGRMGQAIQEISREQHVTVTAQIEGAADWAKVEPANVDVVVDFSTPEALKTCLEWCLKNEKPVISGTTGLSTVQKKDMKHAARKIPLLYSANMSLGIAVMTRLLERLEALKDWDFQIEEAHHRAKIDSPSGTAIALQDKLAQVLGRELPPVHAIRGGGIPGIHEVWAMGPDETLTLQHTAFNRRVFARGALHGAWWLFDKKQPGLYDLGDLYR